MATILKNKAPQRKCIGCNESKPKKELIRIVKTPEGEMLVDDTGRANGRGAYICNDPECLHKNQRIEQSIQNECRYGCFDKA